MSFSKKRTQRTGDVIYDSAMSIIAEKFTDSALIQISDWKQQALRSIDNGLKDQIEEILPYINYIENWKNSILKEAVEKQIALQQGLYFDKRFNSNECKISFTELILIANPDIRPNGWTMPSLD